MTMNNRVITASAPGSVMLAGEYAVLQGELGVVAAVDQRIQVALTTRKDRDITIVSDQLGEFHGRLDNIYVEEPFQFILAALNHYKDKLTYGVNISVHSDFLSTIGLGSSAAVTIATLAALNSHLNQLFDRKLLLKEGIELVRIIQGTASGADVSASVFGGVVGYRSIPLVGEKLSNFPPINLVYSGYKVPTAEAIRRAMAFKEESPEIYQHIMSGIGQCAENAARAIRLKQWDLLGEIFSAQQSFMKELRVSDDNIDEIIQQLDDVATIKGSKISGSGLGDCVIAIGELPAGYFPQNERQRRIGVRQIPVRISEQGVMLHD